MTQPFQPSHSRSLEVFSTEETERESEYSSKHVCDVGGTIMSHWRGRVQSTRMKQGRVHCAV